MSQIRLISGVTDVRKIQFLPAEREHRELRALLESLTDPVFSLSLGGKVDMANRAAAQLLGRSEESLIGESANGIFPDFNFNQWLEKDGASQLCSKVVMGGLDYLMEVTPVYIPDQTESEVLASAVVQLKRVSVNQLPGTVYRTPSDNGFEHFVGQSTKFRNLVSQAKKMAMLDAPLLIQGETGTGKEMLARACHKQSLRADKPFMVVNCVSMPDDAAESELFGHTTPDGHTVIKGIFEQAEGGTVFLYEVGEMSAHLQIKLLRFLQDGTFRRVGAEQEVHVDVRVICSTKKNLIELIEQGDFREDLYYRLNVLALNIPPLRERPSDVLPLAEMFIGQFAAELHQPRQTLADDVANTLIQYAWPGNVRQLRNVLFRAVTQNESSILNADDIALPDVESSQFISEDSLNGSLDDIMKRYESGILESLYRSYPSTRKLAKRLDISHTAIANKLREYGIGKK